MARKPTTPVKYHPGWAIKYPGNSEGEWVAHGVHGSGCWYEKNACWAPTNKTKEEAQEEAEWLAKDQGMTAPYEIIEAWEPRAARLEYELRLAENRAKIDKHDLAEIEDAVHNIENVLHLGWNGARKNPRFSSRIRGR